MSMLPRLNIALVAAVALTAAAWSAPAAANGERPSAAVSQKSVNVATPKKVRRAAVRKRVAAVTRLRAIPPPRWFDQPYERVVAQVRLLIVGVGY